MPAQRAMSWCMSMSSRASWLVATHLRRGGAPFSPLSISGLVAWYDFSDITTLFQDAARTTAVTADGNPIGGVTDKGTGGFHLAQSTDARRPSYKANIQNGLSIGRWTRATDTGMSLYNLSVADAQATTIIGVIKVTGTGYGWGGNGTGNRNDLSLEASPFLYAGAVLSFAHSLPQPFNIYQAIYNGASSALYTNGASTASGNAGTNNLNGFWLGNNFGPNQSMTGDIGEIIIYDSALSVANRALIETYLNTKWNVY